MIQYYRYKSRQEWLSLRKKLSGVETTNQCRVGASDVGKINGEDIYTSRLEFFHQCVNYRPKEELRKLEAYRGNAQEEMIYKNYWRYFDINNPNYQTFLNNVYGERKIFRKARRNNAIAVNDKYPWISATVDYLFQPRGSGILELKSMSKKAMDPWEARVPPNYVIQPQVYMLVYEMDYAELFVLEDSTYPQIYQFEANKEIQEGIIERTKQWSENVIACKKELSECLNEDEKRLILQEYEPEPQGTPSYIKYLNKHHHPDNQKPEVKGTEQELELVVNYLKKKKEIKEQQSDTLLLEAKIRKLFEDRQIQKLYWPDIGAVSWKQKFSCPQSILNNYLEN